MMCHARLPISHIDSTKLLSLCRTDYALLQSLSVCHDSICLCEPVKRWFFIPPLDIVFMILDPVDTVRNVSVVLISLLSFIILTTALFKL